MPGMTLFDLSDLDGPEASSGQSPEVEIPPETSTAAGWRQHGVDTVDAVDPRPEVEVRVSARRKKTSEAKWVGGRIVVSVPAHLSLESRQKTVDWLVERLLTRHHPQSRLGDDELLARAIELSDRYLVGARPVSVRWVTNQTARWARARTTPATSACRTACGRCPGGCWTRCWCTRWPI